MTREDFDVLAQELLAGEYEWQIDEFVEYLYNNGHLPHVEEEAAQAYAYAALDDLYRDGYDPIEVVATLARRELLNAPFRDNPRGQRDGYLRLIQQAMYVDPDYRPRIKVSKPRRTKRRHRVPSTEEWRAMPLTRRMTYLSSHPSVVAMLRAEAERAAEIVAADFWARDQVTALEVYAEHVTRGYTDVVFSELPVEAHEVWADLIQNFYGDANELADWLWRNHREAAIRIFGR